MNASHVHDSFSGSLNFVTYDDNDYLRDRLVEINEICTEIESLNEMTRELSLLVHEQWTRVDCIQSHIQNASNEVQEATKELDKVAKLI